MDLNMVKHGEWYSEYYTVQQRFSAHIKNKQMLKFYNKYLE